MEYFGISNLDSFNKPFIDDFKLFPFIDKEILLDSINSSKIFKVNKKEKVTCPDIHFSMPILFEHRSNSMLRNIWDGINDGDIVTNRGAKASFAKPWRNEEVQEKIVEVNGIQKRIYLICKKPRPQNVSMAQVQSGFDAESVVFNHPTRHEYSIYRYVKSYNKELQCTEHYTCEIDGFIRSKIGNDFVYEPVEFKSFTVASNKEFQIFGNLKLTIATQCELAGLNAIIFGLLNNSTMELKYLNLNEFEADIQEKMQNVNFWMNTNMKNLVKNCTRAALPSGKEHQNIGSSNQRSNKSKFRKKAHT